jgi:hypothetical protein
VHDPTTGIPREVSSLRPDELVEERDSFATGDGDVIPAPGRDAIPTRSQAYVKRCLMSSDRLENW